MGQLDSENTVIEVDLLPTEYRSKDNKLRRVQYVLAKLLLTASIVVVILIVPMIIWIVLSNQ